MNNKYLVIVNPNAGGKKAEKDWPEIEQLLLKANFDFDAIFTRYKHDAIQLVKEKVIEGYKKYIIVGGDGTINEVVNGIFLSENIHYEDIVIGVIMVGTGNDWGRMYNIPYTYSKAIECIKDNKIFRQDVGKVSYFLGNKNNSRYFINAAGMGFDAYVCHNANKKKEKGDSSKLSYLLALLSSLFKYKSLQTNLIIDERDFINTKLFTLGVGIGKYCGGGMQQVPDAIANDGLFDITVVNKIRKSKIVRKINKLYDGSIKELQEIDSFRGKKIIVNSPEQMLVEVDGEVLGHGPVTIEIIDYQLNVIVGTL